MPDLYSTGSILNDHLFSLGIYYMSNDGNVDIQPD